MYSSSTLTKRNNFIHVGTANTIHERPGVYFFYNCFSYFCLLFVNVIYTRWCIIGQVLNGEWKELLIRQVIITSAPTNIFTPYMYAFLFPPMCICILSLRVCPPNTFTTCISISANVCLQPIKTSVPTKYIYNLYLYFRQCVFVFNHYECAH